jgi:hypothetical protein
MQVNALPLEIVSHVLSYVLSARDMLRCSIVCREWKHIAEDEHFWYALN